MKASGRSIVYFQQDFPNLTETFVRAEIEELYKRDYPVKVLCLRANRELLAQCSFSEIVHEVPVATTAQDLLRAMVDGAKALEPRYFHTPWATEAGRL
ncbi:MAG: hypothetical protein KDD69_12410, partial [Bdellovibrionales bacterium]|nr:hypothetical protein [Bdellovibrionales bacterium]